MRETERGEVPREACVVRDWWPGGFVSVGRMEVANTVKTISGGKSIKDPTVVCLCIATTSGIPLFCQQIYMYKKLKSLSYVYKF
jgi:hypothetical protein